MSEIENQVIANLQEKHGFSAAISFHSYSELILWPWGYTSSMQTRDHAFFLKHGTIMGEIMDDYEPMQASDCMQRQEFLMITFTESITL